MGIPDLLWLAMLALPAIVGVFLATTKPPEVIAWVNGASAWWERRYLAAKANDGLLVGGLWRWSIWGFHKLHGWTANIAEVETRAGVRTALFFYVGGFSLLLIASAIYAVVILAMMVIGFWILMKVLEAGNGGSENRSHASPSPSRGGRSRQRKDWLGDDYTEHLDDSGARTGTSRTRKDWLGDTYVERRSVDGESEETSRERKDWLGDAYTEHRNADGEGSGRSRNRRDWLGDDYVEHRDAEGVETARSRERRNWLGDRYTEHKKKE